jgi:ABC-type uncharacterized transport system auxiliary subunit
MGHFKTIFPALVAVLLLSCGGGKIPATHYYALDLPTAPAPTARLLPHSLVVMPLKASSMLAQDRIVYRPSREEVGYYEYHRWAEDPRESVMDALVHKVRASGAFTSVVQFDGRTRSDYILRARIERLEEVDFEGGVKVYSAVSAELVDVSTTRIVWEDSVTSSADVSASNVPEIVRQLSDATGRSLDGLARSLADSMRAGLPAAP